MVSNLQLILNVRLRSSATFSTFYKGPNAEVVNTLKSLAQDAGNVGSEIQMYVWGNRATGKSHLLQALCHEFAGKDRSSVYLPLKTLVSHGPAMLNDLHGLALICVDDVDTVIGQSEWELGLFRLVNASRDADCVLVFSSQQNPNYLETRLADLPSRLMWGPVYKLRPLDDEGKLNVLQAHAKQRGIKLSYNVSRYLLNNYPRDLTSLVEVLDRLDISSLTAKRRITIPFIKRVLEEGQL